MSENEHTHTIRFQSDDVHPGRDAEVAKESGLSGDATDFDVDMEEKARRIADEDINRKKKQVWNDQEENSRLVADANSSHFV
jgi:hypothetical protein